MLIDFVAGAWTDFIKIAPIIEGIKKEQKNSISLGFRIIYSGKSTDNNIDESFLQQLGMPKPNIFLEADINGTESEKTALVMVRYEKVISINKPDILVVIGNHITAMAASLAASKNKDIRIAHLDAGSIARNKTTNSSVNNAVCDVVTDYFFTVSHSANEHLREQGFDEERIFFVGNTVVDTLYRQMPAFEQPLIWDNLRLKSKKFLLIILQEPEHTKDLTIIKQILTNLLHNVKDLPIITVVPDRLKKQYDTIGIKARNLYPIFKIPYQQLYFLITHALLVITDSNNIQDETTVMQTPCISLDTNIGRQETYEQGTNTILDIKKPDGLSSLLSILFSGKWEKGHIPYLWDGKAANRVVEVFKKIKK